MKRLFPQRQPRAESVPPPEICGGTAGRLRRLSLRMAAVGFFLFLVVPLPVRVLLLRPAVWFARAPTRDCYAQFESLRRGMRFPPTTTASRRRFPRTRAAAERRFTDLFFLSLSASELARRNPLFARPAADLLHASLAELTQPEFYEQLTGAWGDPFDENAVLRGNVHYLGRVNLLFGRYGELTKDGQFDTLFHRFSIALHRNFATSPTHSVESEPGCCSVPDQVIALASLAVHDELWTTHYADAGKQWVEFMRSHLDPRTGLLPTAIDAKTGAPLAPPTGAGLARLLPFLFQVDPQFAREQYEGWVRRCFVRCGGAGWFRNHVPGTRPNRRRSGQCRARGSAFAATLLALSAAKAAGDQQVFGGVLQLVESLGLPVSSVVRKDYWFVPRRGDILILWGKSLRSPAGRGRSFTGARRWRTGWSLAYLLLVVIGLFGLSGAVRRARMALQVTALIQQGRVGLAETVAARMAAGRWSPLDRRTREALSSFASARLLQQTPVREQWIRKSELLGRTLGALAVLVLLVTWGVLDALAANRVWYVTTFMATYALLAFAEVRLENRLWRRLREKEGQM